MTKRHEYRQAARRERRHRTPIQGEYRITIRPVTNLEELRAKLPPLTPELEEMLRGPAGPGDGEKGN